LQRMNRASSSGPTPMNAKPGIGMAAEGFGSVTGKGEDPT